MALETKEQLLAELAELDTASNVELAALLAQIEETEAAIENAGSEYDAEIAATEAQTDAALAQYNNDVAIAEAKQAAAAETAAAVTATDASAEISAIGEVTAPTLASNDAADIQAALNALVSDLNDRILEIKDAMMALNNPAATEDLKSAATDLAASNAAIIAAGLPPTVDTQAEIDSVFSIIEALR
jgi:ElaB/YqjD/DUF883 family membrane-anchored ribosome-binding protein